MNIPAFVQDSYKFYICVNVWQADDADDEICLEDVSGGFLNAFDDNGEIDLYNSVDEEGNCAVFIDLDDLTDGQNTLLAIEFGDEYDEADDEILEVDFWQKYIFHLN